MVERLKISGHMRVRDVPLCFNSLDAETILSLRRHLPILWDEEKNVITDVGRTEAARILGGVSADHFDFMAIGDRGVNPSNLDIPLAPSPTDIALQNELDRKVIGTKSVTGNELFLATTFLTTDGPYDFAEPTEEVVNEYSIQTLKDGGVCIARKTFPSTPFGTGDRTGIIVEWRLEIE